MTATTYLRVMAMAMVALAAGAGGCHKTQPVCTLRQAEEDFTQYKSASPSLASGFSREAIDPDRRRYGVVLLSDKSWGRKEPYTGYYAALLMRDGDELVRAAAAAALGRCGGTQYLPNLVAGLSDSSTTVRQEAAVALGRVAGPSGLAALQRAAVLDPCDDVRSACAVSLGGYPRMEAVTTLMKCLDDRAFAVRRAARATLAKLAGRDYGDDPHGWSDWLARSTQAGRPLRDNRGWNPFTFKNKS